MSGMRKASVLTSAIAIAIVLASCSSTAETPSRTSSSNTTASSSTTTSEPSAKKTACARSIDEPLRGLVALTSDYIVRTWESNTAEDFTDMLRVGDDPNALPTEGDFNVAESAIQDPRSCNVLISSCCEPVIGITYYGSEEDGSPKYVMGRLPALSPSGESVAFLAYESINISNIDKLDETVSSIAFPEATTLTVKELRWLDDENLIALAVSDKGSYLYRVSVRDSSISRPELLTADTTYSKGDFTDVGLVGISDEGDLWTRRADPDSKTASLLELRAASDLSKVTRTESLPDRPLNYTIRNGVAVWLHADGSLQITTPHLSSPAGASLMFDVTVPGTYVWAE